MSFFYTILSFIISIFISQTFNKKKVFYIRFVNFLLINFITFTFINLFFEIEYKVISCLVYVSLIFAWSGFIIHISNSIFLSLIKIIGENHNINKKSLFKLYNQSEKYKSRLENLVKGGYIHFENKKIKFNQTFKNVLLLKIIIFLSNS